MASVRGYGGLAKGITRAADTMHKRGIEDSREARAQESHEHEISAKILEEQIRRYDYGETRANRPYRDDVWKKSQEDRNEHRERKVLRDQKAKNESDKMKEWDKFAGTRQAQDDALKMEADEFTSTDGVDARKHAAMTKKRKDAEWLEGEAGRRDERYTQQQEREARRAALRNDPGQFLDPEMTKQITQSGQELTIALQGEQANAVADAAREIAKKRFGEAAGQFAAVLKTRDPVFAKHAEDIFNSNNKDQSLKYIGNEDGKIQFEITTLATGEVREYNLDKQGLGFLIKAQNFGDFQNGRTSVKDIDNATTAFTKSWGEMVIPEGEGMEDTYDKFRMIGEDAIALIGNSDGVPMPPIAEIRLAVIGLLNNYLDIKNGINGKFDDEADEMAWLSEADEMIAQAFIQRENPPVPEDVPKREFEDGEISAEDQYVIQNQKKFSPERIAQAKANVAKAKEDHDVKYAGIKAETAGAFAGGIIGPPLNVAKGLGSAALDVTGKGIDKMIDQGDQLIDFFGDSRTNSNLPAFGSDPLQVDPIGSAYIAKNGNDLEAAKRALMLDSNEQSSNGNERAAKRLRASALLIQNRQSASSTQSPQPAPAGIQ